MKQKNTLLPTILLSMLILSACGAVPSGPQSASGSSSESLPVVTQLIVGTFKLDGTGDAVTAAQAKELLVLWQVYSELLTSDTAAQEEIDGLIEQIQETMTDEQMQAIADMNLGQQDVMTVIQEQGAGINSAQKNSGGSSSSSSGGFGPPDGGGGMPMGAPPDGGGEGGGMPMGDMPAGDQTLDADSAPSAGADFGSAGGGHTLLIEALIEYLESITES